MAEQGHGPADGAPAADPSMEDILASIRRILSEEEAAALPGAPQASGPAVDGQGAIRPEEDGEHDLLELDQSMMLPDTDPPFTSHGPVPEPPPEHASAAAQNGDAAERAFDPPALSGSERSAEPRVPEPIRATMMPSVAEPEGRVIDAADPLVAPAAAAAAASSVGALMRTLVRERSTQVNRGGPTIEDLVREEVRPILKEWLDSHLPSMVERLVRAEIERVVGRMT